MFRFLVTLVALESAAALKVSVVGGSGFVGSRVCKYLVECGEEVTSISKSGAAPEWAAGSEWAGKVNWVANDLTNGPREGVASALGSPDAIVSCVGAVGFDKQQLIMGNGKANCEIASVAATLPDLKQIVYVSVSQEVDDSVGWLTGRSARIPQWGEGYFIGKRQAEAAYLEAAKGGASTTFIKPSFIYGGDSFGLFPPRVNTGYGSGVEELLSNDLIQKVADKMPGLIKVALRPPVSVDAVAGAAAAAALGSGAKDAVLDGTIAINEAVGQAPATGLSDFASSIKGKFSELTSSA